MKLSLLKISVIFFLFASQINSSEDLSTKTSIFDNENQKHLLQIEIQRFILENPEIIIHAIELYKQKKVQETIDAEMQVLKSKKDEILNDGYSFVGGNETGDIPIIEFIDYKCGYCKKSHDIIWSIVENNHDVKYIIKEFPILGSQSLMAAQALLSVLLKHPNEVYKTFSNTLINHKGSITKDILKSFAQKAGAEVLDLEATMNSQEINDMIAKNASLAESLQIRGTPTFILGNQIIRGFISKSDLQELIEIARKQL